MKSPIIIIRQDSEPHHLQLLLEGSREVRRHLAFREATALRHLGR